MKRIKNMIPRVVMATAIFQKNEEIIKAVKKHRIAP
jgi:hypothetical protein